MEWIYCLAGWEGSAHDSRVLKDALSRPNGLKVAKGSFYLCDAGYTNCEGFLTPYRSQRYHLKEWGGNRPITPEEYYNMKHSSARNVIERAFGVLKKRWGILRNTTWFSPDVMSRMVHACILLHNFIRREVGIDELEESFYDDTSPESASTVEGINEYCGASMQPTPQWTQFRKTKAQQMWLNRARR